MSFDTTFDYTLVAGALNNELSAIQNTISVLRTQIKLLQAAPAYESVIAKQLASLTQNIDREQQTESHIISALAEINNVQNLSIEQKDSLYYFYTVLGVNKHDFMTKMLFNYSNALNDQTIQALMSDTVTPADSKVAVAKILYDDYRVSLIGDRIVGRYINKAI